jgi:predicted anti-sigma-YlaC factor YlaD
MTIGSKSLAQRPENLPADCLAISQLQSQALDRELTRVEVGLLKQHFARCECCRARCDELRFVHGAARRYGLELIRKAVKA